MSADALSQITPNFLRYIPLVIPAINKTTYNVDHDLLSKRVAVIGFTALAAFVAILLAVPSPLSLSCVLLLGAGALLVAVSDGWCSKRAADALVLKDYLADAHPSENVFQCMLHNPKVAQALVDQHGDLNKATKEGKRFPDFYLLHYNASENTDFPFFKLLVDNGFDWKMQAYTRYPKVNMGTYFEGVVSSRDPTYLEYLLKHGKIRVNDFTAKEQIDCWMNFGSIKAATLLVEHGFDVNVKDEQGYTPLLRLVQRASNTNLMLLDGLGPMDISLRIISLLENKANPLDTVIVEGVERSVFELNTNPEIASILDDYKAK